MTKVLNKKLKDQRTTQVNQEEFKNQEGFKISRIKIKIQDSRFKNEEKTQLR